MLDSGELLSGRYRLEELLGRGGMGEVWRATDLRLARTVAIKACLSEPDARFTAEARVMASLHHPGIVNIYDYGDSYLVMEFVDGQPLSGLLDERGALDSATAARLLAQVANALQVVHEMGIVHRDVKPANILLDSAGNAKLTDFGVASSGDQTSVQGTARYMAPEQAMGHPVTPAADVYALGAVGYHCLAGFPPFGGEDAVQIALHHIQDALPPLPNGTPPGLKDAVARAMAKDPAQRFPSAAAFAAALELAPTTLASNVDQTVPMGPVERPRRRGALVTVLAAIALITLGGLLLAANLTGNNPSGESPGLVPPAAPASTQPSPAPLVTEQVRRSTPPSAAPSRTTTAGPSPARTTVSSPPPEPTTEPTAAPATSGPPPAAPAPQTSSRR